MKTFTIALTFLLLQHNSFASPGSITPCTEKLLVLKNQNPESYRDVCRESQNNTVSIYDSKNGILRIDTGTGIEEKPFQIGLARTLLGNLAQDAINEVFFNNETHQWVVYDAIQENGDLQQVYLLPENFKNHDSIITFSVTALANDQLLNHLIFNGNTIEIHGTNGKITSVKNEIPTFTQMRKMAYEYFDVRDTGWKFLSNGLKDYPIYDQVKALVNQCDSMTKQKKMDHCFAEGKRTLAKNILASTLIHDPKNADLIQFLGDHDLSTSVTNSLIKGYRDNLASQALNPDYDWSKDSIVGLGKEFFFHYTYDLNQANVVFSPGMYWWKPAAFSLGYAYYPISQINP